MTATKMTAIVPIAIEREERDAEQEQPGERDHDRETAEEDRPAGRAAGRLDREHLVAARRRSDAEPRDHEQRVVDGDGETDQDDELRRVRADRRDQLAVDAEDAERREERRDRQDQRHDRGHDGPEREEQDDERQPIVTNVRSSPLLMRFVMSSL